MQERRAGLLALAASLVIGVIIGLLLVRQAPNLFAAPADQTNPIHWFSASAEQTTFPTQTPDPTLIEGEHPGDAGDPLAMPPVPTKIIDALHALGTKQTAHDVFPSPEFVTATDVIPTTLHRILTTGDGSSLWIGRTSNTLCLLFSSANPAPTDGISAGASCQSLTQFAESGVVLQEGNDHWTWDGVQFTTTIER